MVNPKELCCKLSRVDPGYYTTEICEVLAEKLNRIAALKLEKMQFCLRIITNVLKFLRWLIMSVTHWGFRYKLVKSRMRKQ